MPGRDGGLNVWHLAHRKEVRELLTDLFKQKVSGGERDARGLLILVDQPHGIAGTRDGQGRDERAADGSREVVTIKVAVNQRLFQIDLRLRQVAPALAGLRQQIAWMTYSRQR